MSNFKLNSKELKNLQKQLNELNKPQRVYNFYRGTLKVLAQFIIGSAIRNTPVQTGALRRGWIGEIKENVSNSKLPAPTPEEIRNYTDKMSIKKEGKTYKCEISNNMKYAVYVEYGHRQTPGRFIPAIGKKLVKAFVEGKHMLENAINELETNREKIVANRTEKFMKHILNMSKKDGGDNAE